MSEQTELFGPSEEQRLKEFMQDNFDFSTLKKVGFYSQEIKRTDYKAQAERVCHYFGYESVYEYGKFDPIRCHISYADPAPKPLTIPPHREFVEIIGKNVIYGGRLKEAPVIKMKPKNQ